MKRIVLDEETSKALKAASPSIPEQTSRSPPQPVPKDGEEAVSSGEGRLLPQELMGMLVPSLKVGTAGGMIYHFTPIALLTLMADPFFSP